MPRAAELAERLLDASHRVARRAAPKAQALALLIAAPILARFADVRITGRDRVPRGAFIVAANHPSVLDAVLVALPLGRRVSFMGKSELFTERWARYLSGLGAFPVRRGVWDEEAFATARAVLERGGVVAIFPEGGVSPRDGYKPAKSGIGHVASIVGATVLPIHLGGVRGLYRIWERPTVTITIGPPLVVEREPQPSRERSESVARDLLAAVVDLAP